MGNRTALDAIAGMASSNRRWAADGDAVRLSASIDASRTWLPPVLACRRSIESPIPGVLEILDEIELAGPRPVRFLLHTAHPAETGRDGARITGTRSVLQVRAEWAAGVTVEPCGVDRSYAPVNRIALRSAAAPRHALRTVLAITRR